MNTPAQRDADNVRRAVMEDGKVALIDFQPQKKNANVHTPRGMGALEGSIQKDGWIGAITVAADGETFDGSARLEVGARTGFEDAIVVESDGSRPVVVKRVDIPTADDERAIRLGLAANRVAELNLSWDAGVLASLSSEMDLSSLWFPDELAALLEATEQPDIEFKEYDESVENEVKYCVCPACGHKFPV